MNMIYFAFRLHVFQFMSVHAFSGNQTHDLDVQSDLHNININLKSQSNLKHLYMKMD